MVYGDIRKYGLIEVKSNEDKFINKFINLMTTTPIKIHKKLVYNR